MKTLKYIFLLVVAVMVFLGIRSQIKVNKAKREQASATAEVESRKAEILEEAKATAKIQADLAAIVEAERVEKLLTGLKKSAGILSNAELFD